MKFLSTAIVLAIIGFWLKTPNTIPPLDIRVIKIPKKITIIGDSNTNPKFNFAKVFADNLKIEIVEKNTFVGAAFLDFPEIDVQESLVLVNLGTNFPTDTASAALFFQNLERKILKEHILIILPPAVSEQHKAMRAFLQKLGYTTFNTETLPAADKYHYSREQHQKIGDRLSLFFIYKNLAQ